MYHGPPGPPQRGGRSPACFRGGASRMCATRSPPGKCPGKPRCRAPGNTPTSGRPRSARPRPYRRPRGSSPHKGRRPRSSGRRRGPAPATSGGRSLRRRSWPPGPCAGRSRQRGGCGPPPQGRSPARTIHRKSLLPGPRESGPRLCTRKRSFCPPVLL